MTPPYHHPNNAAQPMQQPILIRRWTSRLVESSLGEIVAEYVETPTPGSLPYGNPQPFATTPHHVAAIFRPLIAHESQEVFAALLLDGRHRAAAYFEISRGTLTSSLVHPREVFGPAVRYGAHALIVAHNHPSGDPAPSEPDREVTRRLRQSGELLGIELLDHLVVTHTAHVSLRERFGLS